MDEKIAIGYVGSLETVGVGDADNADWVVARLQWGAYEGVDEVQEADESLSGLGQEDVKNGGRVEG